MSDLDRYFDRREHLAKARSIECPVCHAPAGSLCTDRWNIPTSLVHQARHTDGYADPYAMGAQS